MQVLTLPIGQIHLNDDNPRLLKDARFEQLVKSLRDFPEMLALRPCVVDETHTVLGGNMRLRALQHLGYTEVPVVVAMDLSPEQKREFVIKDNTSFGEWAWEELANSWASLPLEEWGLDVPKNWLEETPEPTDLSDSIQGGFRVEVECDSETDQEQLYNHLIAEGYKCRLLTL